MWPWVKIQIVPPVNLQIPTKTGSKMGGEFTYQPKWDPKTVLPANSHVSSKRPTGHPTSHGLLDVGHPQGGVRVPQAIEAARQLAVHLRRKASGHSSLWKRDLRWGRSRKKQRILRELLLFVFVFFFFLGGGGAGFQKETKHLFVLFLDI